MWERTLQDLIRGLRANKKDEAKFIEKAVDEIKSEIRGDDMELKAGAVLKLTYVRLFALFTEKIISDSWGAKLHMLGYDIGWASFHVVEVMSSPKIHLKSIGYLAAAQSFDQETDVLMLTTNLLKKDLSSNHADIAVTLNGLSSFMTPDLARDLSPELVSMLNHSRPHIRKRAVLALYKVVVKHPDAIEHVRPRITEKLEDSDPAVVSATINVLCQLVRDNSREYLALAPQLFHLLTTSSNNWMLIKIVKIFGCLSPHEPRLVKKLQAPITELISTTQAISLLYECVHTCIIGGMLQGPSGTSLAKICVSKLAAFIQDSDQNLKYIALLAMTKIAPSHPHLLTDHQETILSSVNDEDISIRMRALDLLLALVNRENLQSVVQELLSHLTRSPSLPSAAQSLSQQTAPHPQPQPVPTQSPVYRLVLCQKILAMCARSTYENVTNFDWYISVLVDLARIANVDVGAEIRDQLVDVAGRVKGVRRYAVKLMYTLLGDSTLLRNAGEKGSCSEVLWAAAWICGEYCDELAEPQKLVPYLTQPQNSSLPADIIAMYIQTATKVFGSWAADLAQRWTDDEFEHIKEVAAEITSRLGELVHNSDLEVQERAANSLQLFRVIEADLDAYRSKPRLIPMSGPSSASIDDDEDFTTEPRFPKSLCLIQPLFAAYELGPVAQTAQASVPVPDGLDLDAWIVEPPAEVVPDSRKERTSRKGKKPKGKAKDGIGAGGKKKKQKQEEEEFGRSLENENVLIPVEDPESPEERAERERRKAERLEMLRDDPYYIIDDKPKPLAVDVDSIPTLPLPLHDLPSLPGPSNLPSLKPISDDFSSSSGPFVIDRDGEMPDGAEIKQPAPNGSSAAMPRLHSLLEETMRPSTPESITVTRIKKKGAKKKKRTLTTPVEYE